MDFHGHYWFCEQWGKGMGGGLPCRFLIVKACNGYVNYLGLHCSWLFFGQVDGEFFNRINSFQEIINTLAHSVIR